MPIKVLIVDDSVFFRRRISEILMTDPQIQVVGMAKNGTEAVEMVRKLKPNIVTMDVEMPIMDGITAVRHIMQDHPVPILMFSSLTIEGAQATLKALDAGAVDFLPKCLEEMATNKQKASQTLLTRIREIARRCNTSKIFGKSSNLLGQANNKRYNAEDKHKATGKQYRAVLIGASTGGPVALQKILTQLPANYPHPVLLIQHMPGAFTPAFATRLNGLCKVNVKEAKHGDTLRPGHAYLAPGGMQMLLQQSELGRVQIHIKPGPSDINYKPSLDITFASATKVFGGDLLAIILTGMGVDGRDGARMLKQNGAKIWTQDEESSVVFGMPQAVFNAGFSDRTVNLVDIGKSMLTETFITKRH